MPVWGEVLSQAVRWLPELHRLVPVLERLTSPEAREEQKRRVAGAEQAAEQARESAEGTRQAVIEATRRLSSQYSDLQATVESCEQRVKDVSAELRGVAESHSALNAQLQSAVVWMKTIAALAIIMIVLLVVVVLKR